MLLTASSLNRVCAPCSTVLEQGTQTCLQQGGKKIQWVYSCSQQAASMGSVPPEQCVGAGHTGRVCHRVAERHSGTGKPTVELGDASHLDTLLLSNIVVQARLISAKSTLML